MIHKKKLPSCVVDEKQYQFNKQFIHIPELKQTFNAISLYYATYLSVT